MQILHAAELDTSFTNGIMLKTAHGNVKAKLGARLQLDGAIFKSDKTPLENDLIVRRARLSLSVDVRHDWRFSLQYDPKDKRERFRSLWLRYSGLKRTDITAGMFQEPFGLEDSTSSKHIIFMERSLTNALVPGTNVGFGLRRWGKHWALNTGIFWETYIEDAAPLATKEGYGISGRLTFSPLDKARDVLHLGFSASYRVPNKKGRVRLRTQPESEVTEKYLISTGRINQVDDYFTAGIEAALMTGPLTLQSEYIQTILDRDEGRHDETFTGGYILASFFLSDAQRHYSNRSGKFGNIKLKNKPLWELAVRRSYLNLNSQTGNITGGKQVNTSWGLNWYPSRNIRLMLNYIQVNTDDEAGDDDPSIVQLRAQLAI